MTRRVVHAIPDRERPARMEVDALRERVVMLEKALRDVVEGDEVREVARPRQGPSALERARAVLKGSP